MTWVDHCFIRRDDDTILAISCRDHIAYTTLLVLVLVLAPVPVLVLLVLVTIINECAS